MKRERALKIVLVVVGLLFSALVYPLMMFVKQEPQGIKMVRIISVVSFSWTAALAGTIMLASKVQMHHITLGIVNFMGISFRVSCWIGCPRADCGANLGDFPLPVNDTHLWKNWTAQTKPEWTTQNEARSLPRPEYTLVPASLSEPVYILSVIDTVRCH
jgi:hypothetical protein